MPEQTEPSHSERKNGAAADGKVLVALCLAATWVVWGSTYLAIRFALESFPPFMGMGARFIAAGVLLLAWTRFRGAPLPTAIEWRNAAIVGALMLGGGMGNTAFAEQTVASGLVVAFLAITPGVITLMSLWFGLRPSILESTGIAVGFVGVALLVRGEAFTSSPAGLAAIFMASVCWSLGSVLSLHRLPMAKGAPGFASEMLCGGVALFVLSLIYREPVPSHFTAGAVAALAYLVVFGSLIAFSAYMTLLSRVSPALATSYTFVNPVIALLLGITLGHETVSSREWSASAVILVGVIILLFGKAHAARRECTAPMAGRRSIL